MARKKTGRAKVEWVGGVVSLPAYVTGEGEPYRPEGILWIVGGGGPIVGMTVVRPGEASAMLAEHFVETTRRPQHGPAHAPARVRIASPDLAEKLRAAVGDSTEVVCAPTPEVDDVVSSLREYTTMHDHGEQTYLSPGVSTDAVAAFFRAAARLYRAKPWKVVSSDSSLLSVRVEKLGVRDAIASVIGQMGQSHGVILFASLDDYDDFIRAADAVQRGERPIVPRHASLNFERAADMSPSLRKEIAAHRWELAGPAALPWFVPVDDDLVARPPTADEYTLAEVIALALSDTIENEPKLRYAWKRKPVERSCTVRAHAGVFEVSLVAPARARLPEGGPRAGRAY